MITFTEQLHDGYDQVLHLTGPARVDEHTGFQHVQIFDTAVAGRVMALDGCVQVTERDESAYSEMLTHLPILEHGNVRRVLIVGGGDGAVAEEVLKHPGVERIDLVDIDGRVVELSRRLLTTIHRGALDDPRVHIHCEDAFAFLERAPAGAYDLAVTDRPDPTEIAEGLYAPAFYERLQRALAERGVVTLQTGCPFFQPSELTADSRNLAAVFSSAGAYLTVVPTYTGGFMALTWGAKGAPLGEVDAATLRGRVDALGLATRHYTPETHRAAFALPPWIAELVQAV